MRSLSGHLLRRVPDVRRLRPEMPWQDVLAVAMRAERPDVTLQEMCDMLEEMHVPTPRGRGTLLVPETARNGGVQGANPWLRASHQDPLPTMAFHTSCNKELPLRAVSQGHSMTMAQTMGLATCMSGFHESKRTDAAGLGIAADFRHGRCQVRHRTGARPSERVAGQTSPPWERDLPETECLSEPSSIRWRNWSHGAWRVPPISCTR